MNNIQRRTIWILARASILIPISLAFAAVATLLLGFGVPVPFIQVPSSAWLFVLLPLWLVTSGVSIIGKRAGGRVAAQVQREQYNTTEITHPHMRSVVSRAVIYRERMDRAVSQNQSLVIRSSMGELANRVDDWVGNIYALAQQMDAYHTDASIASSTERPRQSKQKLQGLLQIENDVKLKQDIQKSITQQQRQLDALGDFDKTIETAELQLESTLTVLGAVYSQALLLDTHEENSIKMQRLRTQISEQAESLQKTMSALGEVYQAEIIKIAQSE